MLSFRLLRFTRFFPRAHASLGFSSFLGASSSLSCFGVSEEVYGFKLRFENKALTSG